MSQIVDTDIGRFRRVTDGVQSWWLWECRCGQWHALNKAQWEGNISVYHAPELKGCGYHETHNYSAVLYANVLASALCGIQPWHEDAA